MAKSFVARVLSIGIFHAEQTDILCHMASKSSMVWSVSITHPKIPAYGMIPSTSNMGLLISINLIYIILHRHVQGFISVVTLNLSHVTIKMNYSTRCQGLRQSHVQGLIWKESLGYRRKGWSESIGWGENDTA